VIARDMQVGARRRHGQQREQQQGQKRDAHGSIGNRMGLIGTRLNPSVRGLDGATLALLCWNLVKHPRGLNMLPFYPVLGAGFTCRYLAFATTLVLAETPPTGVRLS
jgi:hypothetical protein